MDTNTRIQTKFYRVISCNSSCYSVKLSNSSCYSMKFYRVISCHSRKHTSVATTKGSCRTTRVTQWQDLSYYKNYATQEVVVLQELRKMKRTTIVTYYKSYAVVHKWRTTKVTQHKTQAYYNTYAVTTCVVLQKLRNVNKIHNIHTTKLTQHEQKVS